MTVGVVATSYPRFTGDPAGNFVGEHVRALRALGHTVEVIAAGDAVDADAVRVPAGGLFYTGGAPDLLERSPARLVSAARFSARFARAVAQHAAAWDTIVAHWLVPSALACALAAPRTPLLAIAHGGDVHTLRRLRLLAPVLHLLRTRGAELVFVSEELRAIAVAAAPRLAPWLAHARVQPMGVDTARFAAIPRAPTTPPTLVIAARLVPVKGVDVAIAALAHVRQRVRLVIAGDGPERAALERAAQRTGLASVDGRARSTVTFVGAIDTHARDRLFAQASSVLVPSRVVGTRSEGTPLVALEALAAGVPVIASAVGGLRELAGVVRVPPDQPRALAAAIDRVLAAPASATELRAAVAPLDWRRVAVTLVRSP